MDPEEILPAQQPQQPYVEVEYHLDDETYLVARSSSFVHSLEELQHACQAQFDTAMDKLAALMQERQAED